ncbi:MAG: PfkB family carbohydrate kinase, partial [Mesorhizobium sp.]
TAPYQPDAAAFISEADYLLANETEFDLYANLLGLGGHTREERMGAYAAKTGRTVIVTLGADGALAATPQRMVKAPAMKVTPVDTVGAGDTFCGYLGDGIAKGMPLDEAMRRAAIAASLACLKPGAQPAIPTDAEVANHL